jgi:membrane protease YdiL (CAAX protease family)
MDRKTLLLVTLFVEGGLYVFGLLLMGGPSALQAKFNLSWSAMGYALLLCLPMFATLYFSVRSKWEPLSQLSQEIEEKIAPIFENCNIIDLGIIALLAGVGEELFFRGWLQGALTNRLGVWTGILITSIIFGLAHYLSLTYAIYAGLTGLYLGVIYQISGNLYIVMVIHALYDFIALMHLIREGRLGDTGSPTGDEKERN